MIYIYTRCSTGGQEFNQQINTVDKYLKRSGIKKSETAIVSDVASGSKKHTERKLFEVIKKLKESTSEEKTIIVSELSRLGRNMGDVFNIVSTCSESGITLIQAKDGSIIESESTVGKTLLFALSLAAEIELANIRQRTKSGTESAKLRGIKSGRASENYGKGRNGVGDNRTTEEKAKAIEQGYKKASEKRIANTLSDEKTKVLLNHVAHVAKVDSKDVKNFAKTRLTTKQYMTVTSNIRAFNHNVFNDVTVVDVKRMFDNVKRVIRRYEQINK